MRYILIALLMFGFLGCGNDQLASVDGKAVTVDQFNAYLKVKGAQSGDDQRRAALLEQYVGQAALAAAVEKSGQVDGELIAAEVNQYRNELLVSRYFDKFLKDKISDEAVRAYYKQHAAEFAEKQVNVAHILFRTHALKTPEQRKVKQQAALKACEAIKGGQSFAETAKQTSEDTATAPNGGDMGWIKEGGLDQRFSDAAFQLEVGAVSETVETVFGYHVITVLEGPRTLTKPLSNVAGTIRHTLKAEAQSAETEKLMGSVKVKR